MTVDIKKLLELMESKDKKKLDDLGGVVELAQGLGSDAQTGLTSTTEQELTHRREVYGNNVLERKAPPTIFALFVEAMQDTTIVILLIAAGISIIIGIINCTTAKVASCPRRPLWDVGAVSEVETDGTCIDYVEGLAVLLACLLVGSITAINNYKKELQFRRLQAKQDDSRVTVWRGGIVMQIPVNEVCVGDVVQLDTGAKIPADGILIKASDLKIDESSLTGESVPVSKNADEKPFMLSGCAVVEGDARYLVTAVGKYSEWGKIMSELDTDRPDTPLQVKLATVADNIGKLGLAVAVICFLAQTIIWLVHMGNETCFKKESPGNTTTLSELCDKKKFECDALNGDWRTSYSNFDPRTQLNKLVNFFIDSVTIIVVAIPEGLPLAVTISLAYSVQRMQQDQNLVRVMSACETMGGATNICSDKTGTLTENLMTVTQGFFAGRHWADLPTKNDFEITYFDTLTVSMACNSRAELGKDLPNNRTEIIGNKTEGAMLIFLRVLGVDYRELRTKTDVVPPPLKDFPLERFSMFRVKTFPFSSAKKRMSTLVRGDGGSGGRLYTKGASEIITGMCQSYMAKDGSSQAMGVQMKEEIMDQITKMASEGLRTIGIAYCDTDIDTVKVMEDAPTAEMQMIFIGIVGIRDPPRKEVPEAVRKCKLAGIKVRMITGDNILTAKSISKEIGILTADGCAIEGPDFRKMTPEEQREVLKTMEVMARCSPQDKLTMVRRLKEMGEVIAVTGDGTNDAPALKEADVGLSMGITGTAVAQEASDIVIMDDNFSSIVKSVLWGRSVYDNIRRFLQFQMTVNVCALVLCMAGAITGFGTPLTPIQLLWVNLIMDTLAALALATELPTPDMLLRKPYGRHDRLINGHMWRNLLVQALYQVFFLLGLLYGTPSPLQFYDCVEKGHYAGGSNCKKLSADGYGQDHTQNYRNTIIYNSFVWSQLFNEINSRKIYNELNPFEGILSNQIFIAIVFVSGVLQLITVQFIPAAFSTVPLDGVGWAVSLVLGFLSLPLGLLTRFLPPFDFVNNLGSSSGPAKVTPVEPQ